MPTKTTDDRDLQTSAFGDQAIALAEQLGRIAGTIANTAEHLIDRQSLTEQLTRVRDSATQLLNSLGGRQADKKTTSRVRSAKAGPDLAHAPGKKHRKPAPSMHGVKKSDERIAKMRTAQLVRQRRKSYA